MPQQCFHDFDKFAYRDQCQSAIIRKSNQRKSGDNGWNRVTGRFHASQGDQVGGDMKLSRLSSAIARTGKIKKVAFFLGGVQQLLLIDSLIGSIITICQELSN